jgi:hypothetical protein
MARNSGVQKADSFLAGLGQESTRISLINHSISSNGSAYISTSRNRNVAEYFARGENQSHLGFVTEFRVPAGNQASAFRYNEFSEFNLSPNPKIGVSEFEYVVAGRIDSRYIANQCQVKRKRLRITALPKWSNSWILVSTSFEVDTTWECRCKSQLIRI